MRVRREPVVAGLIHELIAGGPGPELPAPERYHVPRRRRDSF